MKNFNMILCFASILFGCSSGLKIQEIPKTANVVHELHITDAAIDEAAVNQVNILSPRNFMDANVSLVKAKDAMDKQKDSKEILHQIAVARAFLKRATEVANQAQASMGEVILARQKAIAAGAAQFYPIEFNKADSKLKDVTADIEADELDSAKTNRASLEKNYQDLELQGMTKDKNAMIEQSVSFESAHPQYSVKEEFMIKVEQDLNLLKKDLEDLNINVKNANIKTQKKAQRKIQSAKKNIEKLCLEIEELKKSTEADLGKLRSKINSSMSNIQKSILDSKKWMSEKMAP